MRVKLFVRLMCVLSVGALLACPLSADIQLITNGDFSAGLVGWSTPTVPFGNLVGSCNSPFAAQTSGASTCAPANVGPHSAPLAAYASTSFPVIHNNVGEWVNYLRQDFVVPVGVNSATLSWFDALVWGNQGGSNGFDVGAELDFGATDLSNFYSISNPGGSGGTQDWTSHSWDVTSILAAHQGDTLTLRFFDVTFYDTRNNGNFGTAQFSNVGIDDVSLVVAQVASAPEPHMLPFLILAMVGLIWVARSVRRFRRTTL
jgi:hypothetical protein